MIEIKGKKTKKKVILLESALALSAPAAAKTQNFAHLSFNSTLQLISFLRFHLLHLQLFLLIF